MDVDNLITLVAVCIGWVLGFISSTLRDKSKRKRELSDCKNATLTELGELKKVLKIRIKDLKIFVAGLTGDSYKTGRFEIPNKISTPVMSSVITFIGDFPPIFHQQLFEVLRLVNVMNQDVDTCRRTFDLFNTVTRPVDKGKFIRIM